MNKYHIIARQINSYIKESKLQSGDKLPTLTELVKIYQASKNTIIKALEVLEHHGVVYQVRGSGIYVRGRHRKGYINLTDVQGFQSSFREFNLSSKVIEVKEMNPPAHVCQNLKLNRDDIVYYIKRIRYIESRPLCLEESYYSKNYVPYMSEEIANDSIFNYFMNDLKLQISFNDSFMRIGKLNKEEAEYLKLPPQDPSLNINSIYYLSNGHPFDYSLIKYHHEEAQFYLQGNNL